LQTVAEGILDRIVASVTARLENEPAFPDLAERALAAADRRAQEGYRSLRAALVCDEPAVIAECKRASPSAGLLRPAFDPVALARAYSASGASAISVVTEPEFFCGDISWLSMVRGAVERPVLRKDFLVDERQLYETVIAGADAVLLIQRILSPERLADLLGLAGELHLEVLLELFADEDPAPAVSSGAAIIGVNARDLDTFAVDLDRVAAIAGEIPDDRIRVAESGIRGCDDLARLHDAGYDAFLIGEHLVRAEDPGAALRNLLEDVRRMT
jgi:indole-3-glycerol phosphate synthase